MSLASKALLGVVLFSAIAVAGYFFADPIMSYVEGDANASDEGPSKKPKSNPNVVEIDAHARKQLGLETTKAVTKEIVKRLRVPGVVSFDERLVTRLRPRTKGRVLSLAVQPGDSVTAGETLATLDAGGVIDARNGLDSAKATLSEAQTTRLAAKVALKRAAALLKIGGISEADYELRQVEDAKAVSAVQTAQANLDRYAAQYERLAPGAGEAPGTSAIVSPITGVVTSAKITVGEVIDTTQDVFTVADPSHMLVQASLFGSDIEAVKAGDPASVDAPTSPAKFEGVVQSINAALDAMTNAASARIQVANPQNTLKANMFVTVEIMADLGRKGVTIPTSSVQETQQGQIAFVQKDDTHFDKRQLTLGLQRTDWTEVKKGVQQAEIVATKGSFGLKAILLRSLLGATD